MKRVGLTLWGLGFFLIAGLVLMSPRFARGQAKVTHGPVVGAVTDTGARILVRTDTVATVQFQLATDTTFANPVLSTTATAVADSDFFVIVDVTGLQSATRYFYRPVLDGTPQNDIGEFVTFPPPGSETTFTFAFGSCQQAFDDPNSNKGGVFPRIAEEYPWFFLHLGDWTYPDTTDTEQNPTNYFNVDYARVQASYRTKYARDFPMFELLRTTAIDYVYDDHDYSNDNSDMTYPGRENSIRGYHAMFPHYPLASPGNGLWHKFTYANCDFFFLDTRSQRHPNEAAFVPDGSGKLVFKPGPEHRILEGDPNIAGETQMDWLIRELTHSTATWKFVVTSVPFNPSYSRSIVELALLFQGRPGLDPVPVEPEPLPAAFIAVQFSDMWGGFPHSVQKLVKAVADAGVENVIMLSGDSHTAAIDDGANAIFPEVMAGALDRTNSMEVALAQSFALNKWNRGGQTRERNNFNNHYGKITVMGRDSVRFEIIDEFGELITSYTMAAGHRISPISLTLAPEGQDFGEVEVGKTNVLPILFINTGADTAHVASLNISDPQFSPLFFSPMDIAPGQMVSMGFAFRPQQVGDFTAFLTIDSNDPQSPFIVPLVGKGISPTAVGEAPAMPTDFELRQNYPNPFNAGTRIEYALPVESRVDLRIVDVRGVEVRRFHYDRRAQGRYFISWDGRNEAGRTVASGVYTYILEAVPLNGTQRFVQSRKLVFVK